MTAARIRSAFRRVSGATTARPDFEQAVFTGSYHGFRVQIQTYHPENPFTTRQQVRPAGPQAEPTLPRRVGFAIGLFVGESNGRIPGLTDALGGPVAFVEHRFGLLNSDTTDRTKHRVALTYLTDSLTWPDTVGHYPLPATGGRTRRPSIRSWLRCSRNVGRNRSGEPAAPPRI